MASTYLSRTHGTSTNADKCTISFWTKRGVISTDTHVPIANYADSNNRAKIQFRIADNLEYFQVNSSSTTAQLRTNRVFRDVNAWYHIVFEFDTSQATASNRIKLYINGVQETSFEIETYPSQNLDVKLNESSINLQIGQDGNSAGYFDGSMAHFHFIDGTAYDADTFGETDATTGIWKPKTAPSVTYGTNGFFLKFENSGSFGTDSSGNANNFTVNGTMTQTIDTPSNVFATLNGISGYGTFSNGNLKYTTTTTDGEWSTSTLSISTGGKWYCEAKMISVTGGAQYHIGISNINSQNFTYRVLYRGDGAIYVGGSQTDTFSSYTTNDIIGMAYDASNRGISFYKNGNLEGTLTAPALPAGGDYFFGCPSLSGGNTYVSEWNFGNGYFGTTAVTSGNADENGLGIFEYIPPTGYYALCTKNLNEFAYD